MKPGSSFRPQALLSFPFFGVGVASLFALVGWLLLSPELLAAPARSPAVLSFVHLAILGWMVPFVFGAAYQLIPVIAESPLASRDAAWTHLAFHLFGAPLLILALARGDFAAATAWGTLVACGAAIGITALAITANRRSRWVPENAGLLLALFWLLVTVVLGALLTLARTGRLPGVDPAALLRLHMACGLAGFFLGTLIAVSFKLLPMFLLGTPGGRALQWTSLAALNSGLFLLGPGLLGDHPTLVASATAALAAGVSAFLIEVARMHARRLRTPDWPMRTFLVGVVALLPSVVAGAAALLDIDQPWLPQQPGPAAFGLVAFGVLTPCILGMAGKIVPFLAWQWRYADHVGRAKVPLVTDLFHPWLLRAQFAAVTPAVVLLTVGLWTGSTTCLRLATAGLFLGALSLALNLAGLVPHIRRPRLQPLTLPPFPQPRPAPAPSARNSP